MAVYIPFLPGKKKVIAAWVLWPVVTAVLTIVFVKTLGLEPMAAAKLAGVIGASIPAWLVGEFIRDIKRSD